VIVLDTHAWLWWMTAPERLSQAAREAIEQTTAIGVSSMSAWELAMLARRGHISLDREIAVWVRQAFAQPRLEALPPTVDIAVAAALLDTPSFPGDPIDRVIYATTKATDAQLITRDEAIRTFDPQGTLW
jgi:PIN domain nuclease of toxin-antitoxin system